MRLAALLLAVAPLSAADLAVSNAHLDAKKPAVEFDLANSGAKPVHAWLIDVVVGNLTSRVTPQNCLVLAAQSWHCTAIVDSASGALGVRIHATLYDDGTATGDLKMLQDKIDDTSLRLRALEAWQKDFRATPPGIAYTSAVMHEREIVEAFAAKETPEQITLMLQARINTARELARFFPVHNPRYAPEEATPSARSIKNKTARFPIVLEEERAGRLRLVMRNDYDREIAAFAFMEVQDGGKLMRSSNGHTIRPGGLQEYDYGTIAKGNNVELACVIFKDGTADGDAAVVRRIRDGWKGRDAENARILPLVRAIAALPPAERPAATEKLIAELKAHPQEQPDADHTIGFTFGEQAARRTVIRDLRDSSLEDVVKHLQE